MRCCPSEAVLCWGWPQQSIAPHSTSPAPSRALQRRLGSTDGKLHDCPVAADGSGLRVRKRGCLPWRRWSRKVFSPDGMQLESSRPLRDASAAAKADAPNGEVAVVRVHDAYLADSQQR